MDLKWLKRMALKREIIFFFLSLTKLTPILLSNCAIRQWLIIRSLQHGPCNMCNPRENYWSVLWNYLILYHIVIIITLKWLLLQILKCWRLLTVSCWLRRIIIMRIFLLFFFYNFNDFMPFLFVSLKFQKAQGLHSVFPLKK